MKFTELKKSLKQNILPAYLVKGEDSFLRVSAVNMINKIVVTANEELNIQEFSTESLDVKKVLEACNTLPFFSDKKIVLIKEYTKNANAELTKALNEYLKDPNETTCLILVSATGGKAFANLKNIETVDCSFLSMDLLKKWVAGKLKSKNKTIDVKAAEMLIDYCNFNLTVIDSQLNKIVAYCGNSDVITIKDVDDNTTKTLEFQVFELTAALSQKNSTKSIIILNTLLDSKTEPTALINLIYNHFRRLFHISVTNESDASLASKLKVKEYAIKKSRTQAKMFSQLSLKNICELCLEVESDIKTGKMNANKAINYLVFKILQG